MIGKLKFMLFFSLVLFFGCGKDKKESFLSFSLNGQDGDTSYSTAWEIQSNGSVYLYGGSRSINKGNYCGKLSERDLKYIFKAFSSLKLSSYESFGSADYRVGNYFEFRSNLEKTNTYFMKGEYSKLPNNTHYFF
jgi:hypothetical protein